jgi:hypothetical protein
LKPVSPVAAGEDPMDLSSQRRFASGGKKKREKRFRCGSKNHRVAACPKSDNCFLFQLRQFRASYIHRSDSPDSAKFVSPFSNPPNPINGVNLS